MALFSGVSFVLLDPVMNLLFTEEMQESTTKPDVALKVSNIKDGVYYLVQNVIQAEGRQQALLYFIFMIVGLNFVGNLSRYFSTYFEAILRTRIIQAVRADVFHKLIHKQLDFIDKQRKGDLMIRLTSDVDEVERSVVGSMKAFIKNPIQVVLYIVFMLQISAALTGFMFLVLPISALFISIVGKSLKKDARDGQTVFGHLLSVIEESISGLRVIKAFRAEGYTNRVFTGFNQKFNKLYQKQLFKKALASPFSETMGVITVGVILWFGGNLVFKGDMEASGFIAYIVLFVQTLQPAKGISTAVSSVYKGLASADRIFQLVDHPVEIKSKPNALPVPTFEKAIAFKNVSFAYEQEPVLHSLNMHLAKGGFYALVGPSGCGKSTTAELIMRFYDPQHGQISIDGQDLRDVSLSDLRSHMSMVTQEPILFHDTVYNNIVFGLDNVPEVDVVEAASAAHAHEFISQLPKGYDTVIGDRGTLLSGGQRQRISIARAILRNAPILLLDEATSALDTESEKLVQDALVDLMKDRTSLVIAHRLSTIQRADRIFVMEAGRIVEEGHHQELIALKGLYWQLTQLQQIAS